MQAGTRLNYDLSSQSEPYSPNKRHGLWPAQKLDLSSSTRALGTAQDPSLATKAAQMCSLIFRAAAVFLNSQFFSFYSLLSFLKFSV